MYRFSLRRRSFKSWSIETQNFDLGDMFWTTTFENHRQEDISPWSRSRIVDRSTLEDFDLPEECLGIVKDWEFRLRRCCRSEVYGNVDFTMRLDQTQVKIRWLSRWRMSAQCLSAYRGQICNSGLCIWRQNIMMSWSMTTIVSQRWRTFWNKFDNFIFQKISKFRFFSGA